jgi:hypothetical protein
MFSAQVLYDELQAFRDKLSDLSRLDEDQIQRLWSTGDGKLPSPKDLEYSYDAPLYVKMIFRFRQNSSQPACFWNSVDPANQRYLQRIYSVECTNSLYFLSWIWNMVNLPMMENWLPGKDLTLWKTNTIEFYFSLSKEDQLVLLDQYEETNRRLQNY